MFDFRRDVLLFSLGAAVATTAFAKDSKTPIEINYCTPYLLMGSSGDKISKVLFPYDIRVNQVGGRKEVVIAAPGLSVSSKQLGTLLREPAYASMDIVRIRVDAKEVNVEGNLSLVAGQVEIVADKVTFQEGASIAILPDGQTIITISARVLEFPSMVYGHFDIRQRDVEDMFQDIPRLLQVNALDIRVDGVTLPSTEHLTAFARRFSLDGFFDFTPKISLASVDAAKQAILAANQQARWPRLVVQSWIESLKVAPFSPALRTAVTTEFDADAAYIEPFLAAEQRFYLQQLGNALRRRTDIDGNGPAFAPVSPLITYREKVAGYASSGGPQIPALLNSLQNLANGTQMLPTSALDKLAKELEDLVQGANAEDSEMARISARLTGLGQLSDQHQNAYNQRVAVLKADADQIKKSKRDLDQTISLISTATAIGTTAYTANPQAGAAAGGLVYAIGNSANGREPLDSIQQGVKFAQAIKGPLEAANKSLGEMAATRDKYKTFVRPGSTWANLTIEQSIQIDGKTIKKDDALDEFGDKIKGFSNSVGGLTEVYEKFSASTDAQEKAFEADDDLRRVGEELASVLAEIKSEAQKLEALQRSMGEQQVKIVGLAEKAAAFKTVDVTNSGDSRRLGELLAAALKEEMIAFVEAARNLQSVHLLEFGIPLQLPPNALLNLTLAQSYKEDLFDAGKVANDRDALLQLHAVGSARLEEIKALASLMVSRSKTQVANYLQTRGQPPVSSYPDQPVRDSWHSPPKERLFIRAINQALLDQFNVLRSGLPDNRKRELMKQLASRRYPVPIEIVGRTALTSYPQRLVQLVVSEITPKEIGSSGLDFMVDVERAGNLRSEVSSSSGKVQSCMYVDLRDKRSPEDAYFKVSTSTLSDIAQGRTFIPIKPTFWYLEKDVAPQMGSVLFNYQPADARTYLRIRLDPDAAWLAAPRLDSITFKYEIFQ